MNAAAEPLAGDPPQGGRRNHRKLVTALTLVVALLLALFLPPLINLKKYRRSITNSISGALGRSVSVGEMQLRLLPTPGIVMTDFTVAEDPAFGYEPALHANSMVASLRLTSLWRGRLEVSRISLDEASLNLVKNDAGQWNIASILLRASQIPNEPTAERHAGPLPRFPYVEATDARINFKEGVEKRPFSLSNAEFSMWQASGGEWRLRLKAQPVRTDLELHLSDTGELTVEGSLRRAASLAAMPVNLRAEWSGAQLGQASRLIAGMDSGWRGDLDATATIEGTAGDLAVRTRVRIGNLQRQEFQPASTLNVDATCQSRYQNGRRLLGDITCFLPEGQGHLLLTGNVRWIASPSADLDLEVNQVPAQFPLSLAGLMRPRAETVTADGRINGLFHLTRGEAWSLTGDATATGVTLTNSAGTLALPEVHLTTQEPQPSKPKRGARTVAAPPQPAPLTVIVQPFAVSLGEPEPLTVDARLAPSGFVVHASGAASLDRLRALGGGMRDLGNAVDMVGAKGRVDMETTSSGAWIASVGGGPTVTTTGSMKVQSVELRPAFLPAPVEIESAEIGLTPEMVDWQNVALQYQALAMHGSLQFPTVCSQPTPCPAIFALQPGDANAAMLQSALQGRREGFFGKMLADLGGSQSKAWPPLTGSVQCKTLDVGRLTLRSAVAAVSVDGTSLNIRSLDGETLGGTIHATGTMAVEGGIPQWSLDVQLKGIQPSQTAEIFRERWGSGTANLEAQLNLSGSSSADLASSATGHVQFTWMKGGLAAAAPALPFARFDRWTGEGSVAGSTVTLTNSTMTRGSASTTVQGRIGFDRRLNLTFQTVKGTLRLVGTLAHPSLAR
ncbi:MAG TPA: AsmA family protein [Acidobacteriaceae bacterium]|nr:AsmA family protein [Acidobacteriaceae bacterium]